ncbi:NtaA/DmoA family FMN-dependent monooxygenase [Agrobacterium vitis]|uniref:LLM class flavin-dependent oxidoreductase n=1 Tax=Rhizobium/Agrobacterium group TaxID=227290 RepID=UPI0012E7DAB8|nr:MULTISPECIES: LLM class flavin-dependent oxidoreductase [Rhizobium/Agrobacterium group]MCF1432558.1 LLM class flavin-dependent oxidoreductase [Allorhizobium ampelinum]MUO87906.1 NtaA/DmoA family FMN-dependent monooxygenase [Agrobacterium vitis]MUZ50965.1 NtaA/DmoA family FMN-dependent monooxygenase [Agrobacterium vitis]MUZ90707.1 NtaA/DmoA family FMN-dependent monooxygenase [Agrobacterium vitis]MVA38654.1 NtaA/DmoA family FMN-dependent monooxygenase [Agrobacterium vitis]
MTRKREIHLGLFLQGAGHHVSGWRHPNAEAGSENFDLLRRVSQLAEQAKFDMVFLADGLTSGVDAHPSTIARFEPLTLLAALAMVTEKIGLAATASTTYGEPYHVARAFSSIDHLSQGRAAWNIVTTSYARTANNFTKSHPGHDERYAVAEEFVDVVRGLWDSWDDDAFIKDKQNGIYADPTKVHLLDHTGKYFSVKGPLNIPRSPQGHPILIQAGSSGPGQDLAARTADVVFTAQQSLDEAQAFYKSLKDRVTGFGRHPDDVAVMPGFLPVIGRTAREAADKLAELDQWTELKSAMPLLEERIGHSLADYDPDGPLPDLPISDQLRSRAELLTALARRENLTIRQLALRVAAGRGHHIVLGTPEDIADRIQQWFETRAADGFNIMPPFFPEGLEDFTRLVVPILQERGLFRTDYSGVTLRDHLGVSRPNLSS